MIDRLARTHLAEGIRHLAAGVRSNWKFEDESVLKSADPAIQAVFSGGPWFLYSDFPSYRLRGQQRLNAQVRREVARWILFLKTDLPYEWPIKQQGILGALVWIVGNLLTLGAIARAEQQKFAKHGDFAVWPFIRNEDFQAALANPVYLVGPSNPSIQSDAQKARASDFTR